MIVWFALPGREVGDVAVVSVADGAKVVVAFSLLLLSLFPRNVCVLLSPLLLGQLVEGKYVAECVVLSLWSSLLSID